MTPFFAFAQKGEIVEPTAPQNLEVEPVLDNGNPAFNLTWSEPESDGGSTISGYNVFYRQYGAKDWLSNQTTNLSYSIVGEVLAETKYEFAVSAYNIIGESPQTDIVYAISLPLDIDSTPPVISDLQVTGVSGIEATVSWLTDEPASSSVAFDVHSADQHQIFTSRSLTTEHSFNLTELIPCTTYFYYISSEDAFSNNSTSDIKKFNTTGCLGGVTNEDVSELIPPEVLASFQFNGSVDVSVQDGLFGADSVFQVKRLSVPEVDANVGCPAGNKPVGSNIYDIKFLDDFNSKASLSGPASVTIDYEDGDLDGINENSISMFHYDEDLRVWTKLESCTRDTSNNTVTCQVSNFSKFALMGESVDCLIEKPLYKNLFLFSFGEDVKNLKNFLNRKGYAISEEGNETKFYGFKTFKAVKDLQRNEIMSTSCNKSIECVLGLVGRKTREAINSGM